MKKLFKNFQVMIRDMDKPLLIVSLVLFLFGTINIVTASSSEAASYNVSLYYYFYRQIALLLVGMFISLFILNIPTKKWRPIAVFGYIGITVLLGLTFTVSANRGANNWVFGVQPSEFAKPVLIVSLALLFESLYKKLRTVGAKHYDIIAFLLFVGLLFPAIVFLQKDVGSMLILAAIFVAMIFTSPLLKIDKLRVGIILVFLVMLGALVMYAKNGYILTDAQLSRFNFFNPCDRYETGGYQVCNSFIAIHNGGLFGVGPGKSTQKYSYIPEAHTDSVFAIIVEEYGLLLSTVIFGCYIFILKRILDISKNATTRRGQYMALGVATYIFSHIFINLGGLFGVIPLTGVPLPFLSYGGSFAISLVCSLAIVQRVHIETRREKIQI